MLVVILFQGFATHTVGGTGEGSASQAAPLAHAGEILASRKGKLVTAEQPNDRRIALTFDDGPSERWTLPIARTLHRYGVRATFFEIGGQAARYPGIPRQLLRYGDELGNHTFTHVLLSSVPMWEARLQLQWTEAVFAGVTGHYTRLVRPPYSSEPTAVTPADERTYEQLMAHHYYVVLTKHDSEDWARPGVAAILRNAMPRNFRGGIVLFHDGGGDRAETLAAIRKLIPLALRRGFRFVTVSQLAGLSRSTVMPGVTGFTKLRSQVFVICVRAAYLLTDISAAVLLTIAGLTILRTLLLAGFATYERRKGRKGAAMRGGTANPQLPSAVIIVPAYNEQVGIEKSVRSLAATDYPDLEIVVVDDGSTDETAAIVAGLDLPNVRMVSQDNAGKAVALQRGIDVTDSEVVAMVDADTQFEPLTLRKLVEPFHDPAVAAVSGNTKVGNRGGLIGRWQHLEYVIGFNLDRRMYHVLRCMPTVPGAIGAFRRDVLEQVGGVPADTMAEDTDLTIAIGRTGRGVVYEEQARAWTEAPSSFGALWKQRYRWSFGTMQSVWKHRGALLSLRPEQRRIGWITLPYLTLFYIVLPLLAPMIDLFAVYGFLFLGPVLTVVVWGAFNLLAMATAAYALWMDRESLSSVWAVPVQQFVYRQLMYLVIIEASVRALQGIGTGWRHVARTGDAVVGTGTTR